MHFTPWPAWLMIVSIATVVLPVLRSPMISSRCPRPIGVMASMALIPVWRGSLTGWRPTMPGACTSMRRVSCRVDRALAVDGLAQCVDDAAQQGVADGHGLDPPRRLDRLLLLEVVDLAEDHGADGVLVEVQGKTERAVLELEQLVDRGAGEARHPGDAVADLDDATDLLGPDRRGVVLDVALQRLR